MSSAWKDREFGRFVTGEYKFPPWGYEPWWLDSPYANVRIFREGCHYTHVSTDDPSKVAYTPTEKHGEADRQVRMKPGKYLHKYFSDVLKPEEIAQWAGKFAGENEKHELHLAKTPDEIEKVFVEGPRSCMFHDVESFDSSVHPVRVYGAGDLAVAYIMRNNEITARTICWPEKRIYVNTGYGDTDRLKPALESEGYEPGAREKFVGARLLRIPENSGFVAPYLDIAGAVNDNGDYLILCLNGEYVCDTTNGITGGAECKCCNGNMNESYTVNDEEWCLSCYENDAFTCESCETAHHTDGMWIVNDRYLCRECFGDEAFICDKCGDGEYKENGTEVGGEFWCESCRDRYLTYCDRCEDYTSMATYDVGDKTWCEDCFQKHAEKCEDCEDYYDLEKMKAIGHRSYCSDCYDKEMKDEEED